MVKRYYVLVNPWQARVFVTGNRLDLELIHTGGWWLMGFSKSWVRAYEAARAIADRFNYTVEWYLEEEREYKARLRRMLKNSRKVSRL
mgnify:FL=1